MHNPEGRELILETFETMFELQLRSVRRLLNRENDAGKPSPQRGRRRKSLVDLVVELLTEEKHPMHVDRLVESLRQRYGRATDRDSLSSALAKKARQGALLRRVAPATFALKEEG